MQVIKVKLSELVPDPKNTRVHDSHNIEVIKNSLKKFGQYRPFVVQKEGMIIRVGNGMYQAMKELGWTEADCEVKDITDEEATTLSILDNKSSDLSYFDDTKVYDCLKNLGKDNVALTGFVDIELNKLFSKFETEDDLSSIAEIQESAKEEKKKEDVKPVLQYQIVFSTEETFRKWIKFVDYLRDEYDESICDCLIKFIDDKLPELNDED